MDEIQETYRIKSGSAVSRTISLTETGPIMSEAHKDSALSLKWTGRDGTGLFPALYALNRAQAGKEVEAAARFVITPCMNIAWADGDGNCGIQWAGSVPVRASGSDGKIPMPAWTGVHDWGGFFSFGDLPSVMNPRDGFSVAANGRPGGNNHPVLMGCYWDSEGRSSRIKELLVGVGEHSKDSFQSLHTDTVSPLAKEMSPIILNAIAAKGLSNQTDSEAARIVSSWDFQMNRESAAAAIFGLFYQALVEELLSSQLGEELYEGFTAHSALPARLVREIFVNKNHAWIGKSDPDELLCRSFHKGVSLGKSLMAADPKKWQWGEIHKTEFRHPLAARSRFLEALYDVGPISLAGSRDTINFAGWSQTHAFKIQDGVSLRQIADMTQPPELSCVSPMGSSAHFFSTHYKDQTSAWLTGRASREPVQTAEIRKSGFNPVVFKSKPTGAISMKQPNSPVSE